MRNMLPHHIIESVVEQSRSRWHREVVELTY